MKQSIQLLTLTVLSLFIIQSNAQQHDAEQISFKTTEVANGIYMLSGEGGFAGGNMGLLVGDEAVVLIDDSMPQFLDRMQQSIQAVTERPIDYVLNTHLHGDHSGNNAAMHDSGAHVVAHENVRKRMIKNGVKKDDVMQPAPKNTLPVITFEQVLNLYFNDQPMKITHMPHAHTDGDSVIHFTQANVIHAGDVLFNGRFPFIDLSSGGSVDGMIAALQQVHDMANDQTQIIPGHGPLANKSDVKGNIDMLTSSRDRIKVLLDEGLDEAAILEKNPLADYGETWSWGFITTERMTKQLIQDLSQNNDHNHG